MPSTTSRWAGRALSAVLIILGLFAAPSLGFAQPTPVVTLTDVQAEPLLGEPIVFNVAFDNASATDTGYGPYIDLVLPSTGVDGAISAPLDGVTFVGATYLGAPVTATVLTFDGAGHATHPYARTSGGLPLVVNGPPYQQLVVLQLPFGSFTPTQPPATVLVAATLSNLADAGAPLSISASGGFQYGADALDNPATDPSITGASTNASLTPTLLRLKKTYIGPEDETASGPNFPREYLIEVDIADGQTLTNLDLTDVLPNNLQFLSVVSTTIRGSVATTTAVNTPGTTTPGGTLTRRFASVSGTTAENDATLRFAFYVPRTDASAAAVIDPLTGNDVLSPDDARAQGTWTPIDPRDGPTLVTSNVTAIDHELTDKSIAIQKGYTIVSDIGATGATPGDVVEYTLSIQVSDYFAFQNLVVTDLIGDGLRRDPGFAPTLSVSEHGAPSAGTIAPANFSFVVDSPGSGATTATFQISNELILRALDCALLGGCVPVGGTGGTPPDCAAFDGGGTTMTIVYRAVIQEDYSDSFPSGDPSVDEGDVLSNAVTVAGDLLDVASLAPNGNSEDDDSSADVIIAKGELSKGIYAINGNTSYTTPVRIGPGDTVTYWLRATLPTSDIEPFTLTDYLPLPIFAATTVTTFSGTQSAVAPASGTAQFGPNDTFFALSGLVPGMTTDATGNSVAFLYPEFDSPSSPSTVIEILFTVTASNLPFADKLFLTNQVQSTDQTTQMGASTRDAIIQLELTEPDVRVTKGVVATNSGTSAFTPNIVGPVTFSAPGSSPRWSGTISSTSLATNPITSDLSGVDAGDLVSFAIVLENRGSAVNGAFDVRLRDTLPAGFAIPVTGAGLNLQVRDGAGTLMPFTAIGGGLFDPAGGIELTDGPTGALATASPTGGLNLVVVTYDLELQQSVQTRQVLTNTATLFNFAGVEGGPDHTATDRTDTASVTIGAPTVAKAVTSTDQAHTSGNNVAIGEHVTYTITVRVPEGVTPAAVLVDTLPAGLAVVSLQHITTSSGVSTSNPAVVGAAVIGAVGAGAANAGRTLTMDFGTITNVDTNNLVADTITLVLETVVINGGSNDHGDTRANAAVLTYTGGTATGTAPNVTIAEPTLAVGKVATPNSGDAGDEITFTITVTNTSGVDAFNATLSDVVPAGMTFSGLVSSNMTGGVTGDPIGTPGNGVTAVYHTFPTGGSATIVFTATLDASLAPGQVMTNSATVLWTSLPGSVLTPQSTHNTLSTERTGNPSDPGAADNDYTATGTAAVTAVSPQPTKSLVTTSLASTTGNNVAVGETVQYQVQIVVPEGVSNTVTLVDTLPAGMAFVSFDSLTASPGVSTTLPGGFPAALSNAAVTMSGSRATFTLNTLTNADSDNGTTETITFTYTAVVLNAAGNQRGTTLTNTAVWGFNGSTVDATGPALTVVEPGLQVVKAASPTTGDAGDTVTYTLTISHASGSNADAYDAVLTDVIPAGLQMVGGSLTHMSGVAPGTLGEAAGTITATYTTLAAGQTSVLQFQALLNGMPSPVTPAQVITNTAAITWTSLPGSVLTPQSTHNSASTERTGSTSDPGAAVNDYRASDTEDVTVHTSSISGFVYVDMNNDGSRTGGEPGILGVSVYLTGTDHLGNPVHMLVTTAADGSYSFTGLRPGTYTVIESQPINYLDGSETVGTPALGGTVGPMGSDTIGTITLPAATSTTATGFNFGELASSDLSITKSDNPATVLPGGTLAYTLTVENAGPQAAANAVLTDPLPGGTTFVSLPTVPGWSCSTPAAGASGTISCTNPSLPVGQSVFTVTVAVDAGVVAHSQLHNVATITSTSADRNPKNNVADEVTIVAGPDDADLEVTKTDSVDPVTVGGTVTYTITVRNHGPATTDATVTDTLPAGLTLIAAVPSIGTCGAVNPVVCDFPGMVAGSTATITVTATATATGVSTNTVTVTGTQPDPNPSNDQATEPTTVLGPGETDVAIVKTGPLTVARGANLIYTLVVTNNSTVTAADVEVQDTLALPGLTFVSNTVGCATPFPCVLGTMNPGESRTIVSIFAVDPAYSGVNPVPNTATVTTTTPDANPDNNTSTVETRVADAASADLTIIKIDSPDAAVAGTDVAYTLVVTNNGPGTAVGVDVTDTLPAGVTLVSSTPSQGSCSGPGPVTCALGTLANGANATIAIVVRTASALPATNPIVNSATVSSTSAEVDPTNNTATQPTTIVARTDMQITKTAAASVNAGAPLVYTITVTNAGPSDAANVAVTDPTPAGLTFVSNSGDCTTAFPCDLGTVTAGATRTITATYLVPSDYTAPSPIVNVATVSTDTTETNTLNNTGTASTTLTLSADLALTKSGPPTVSAGGSVVYTVTITNNGPSDAATVQVTDPTPAGLTFTSNSGDCTTAFPCSFATLPAGESRTITATYLVPSGYTTPNPILNTATVTAATPDPDSDNNSASASTTLGAPSADVMVTKTGPATAIPGNNIAFTIVVTNNGPADAEDVMLSDTTPTGLTFVSNAGDCSTAFPCTLGTLVAGESRTITATYLVPAGYTTPDPIINTATVASSTADADLTNNTSSAEVSVGADLSLTKTATPEPVAAGSLLTFTVVATNGGARDAVDLVITDSIPAGTTFESASASTGGACVTPSVGSGGTVTCTWTGVTAATETRTLILTVRVDPGTPAGTTIPNAATTSSQTNDPDLTNNSASSTSTVTTAADIAVTKTVDNASPNVGDEVVYTVTVRNDGPSHATGVAVTDALPPELELVLATPSRGTYDAPSGLWTIGALDNGAFVTMTLRARVVDDGAATNTVTKTAGDQIDPDTSNNTAAATLTSNPVADVRVLKQVDVTAANVGSTVTFTILAANAGPSDATGVRIVDALPAGLTFVSADATSGTFDEATGIWEIATLPLDAEATLTLRAIVNTAGPILNEARKIALNELDPNPANDASGATVNGLSADIQVVKTLSAASDARVGQHVTFFITASNNGPSAATGVRVRDALPAGLAYVSSTATRGVYVPQTGVWDIGALAATGAEATATLEVRAVVMTHETITNRALVMPGDQPDPNPLNNESSVSIAAMPIDLADRITTTSDPGAVGSTADFFVDVTNVGDATSVSPLTIAVPLPAEYDYVPVTQPGWTCTLVGHTVFCQSTATLARAQRATVLVRVRVNAPLPWGRSLFAHLTTPRDSVSPNNVTQLYLGLPPEPDPDMGVAQTVTVTGSGTTKTLTYSILVDNHGPLTAHHAVLTDVIPAGATLVSASVPSGPCEVSGSFVACAMGSILPGHAVYATIVLTAEAPGAVTHTVSVSSDQFDLYPRDNQSVLMQRLDPPEGIDTDEDGLPDTWESLMGLSVSTADADGDADGDGVSNIEEYRRGTHPKGTEHRYFAEGASNEFFSTTLAVLNPSADAFASVMVELLKADGTIASQPHLLSPLGRLELDAATLMAGGGTFSVLVESDRPVAADRDMRWDRSGYGSTGESGTPSASTTWYFAEGATGQYSLFYLIENPSMTQSADVKISYLLPGGRPPVVTTTTLAPHSRETIFVNELATQHPELGAAEIAATMVSTNAVPIVAERAMYLNGVGRPMGAGHAGLGATSPSTSWFFAEGATGAFFNEYILLANPNASATTATVRYLLPDGTSFEKPYDLLPTSRQTIDVAGQDARLAATSVAAIISAPLPIVAERVMWWPGRALSPEWYEAHVSLGATVTGLSWAIAGGAAGGFSAEQTFALVANQEARAGEVRITVSLDDGTKVARTLELPATSRQTIEFAAEFPQTHNQHFSAVIESVGATPVPIVVEWSRYSSPNGQAWGAGSGALATKVR